MKRWASVAGIVFFAIAWLNFAVCAAIAFAIGGDAFSGKIDDGRYYLHLQGRYTEVSRTVWTYSRIHTSSIAITHPLGLAGIALTVYLDRKRPAT